MTSNQINYRRLLEDRRHNRAQESEAKRANLASERLKKKDQMIQENYNAAHFMHNTNVLMETARHNLSMESKDLIQLTRSLAETERHNRETEQVSRDKLTQDYGLALRDIALRNANISEVSRHNLALESMQSQVNAEVARHNLALESMQSQVNAWNYELGREKNEITSRSVDNQYAIDRRRVAEMQRSNVQGQLLEYQKFNEQKRHNLSTEQLTRTQNTIRGLQGLSSEINTWYKTLSN